MQATASHLNISHAVIARLPVQMKPARAISLEDYRPSFGGNLEDYLAHGALRGIEAKEHVFNEGDPKGFVYTVVTGAVCLYRILSDGRRQVIDFAYPGDVIGLGTGAVETFNAQATVATRVKCVPASSLRSAAARDAGVALGLYEALSRQLASMRNHLVCVGQQSATERLVNFLLTLSHRNEANGGDPEKVELRMTRHDIGDFLGLTIETVSRTFSKLKSLGVIEIDQGTTIRLVDIDQLEEMADGESRH
jgi:CRP/FNR family transcriptional regulator